MSSNVSRRDALKGFATLATASILPADLSAEGTRAPFSRSATQYPEQSRDQSFDDGWRFYRGDAPGAEDSAFDDAAWRKLDLPHDWSIEDLPPLAADGQSALWNDCTCPTEIGPFSKSRSEGRPATAWTVGGVGWYRKSFATPRRPNEGRVSLRFDGVYMNSELWINGKKALIHPHGYTSFELDLTPYLREPGPNVLAVKVNNSGKNSRWYSGSGIYRHVWLTVTEPVYVPLWGVSIAATDVSPSAATIAVSVQVKNGASAASDVTVRLALKDADANVAVAAHETQSIPSNETSEIKLAPVVNHPRLWSPTGPHLYRADVEIVVNNKVVDRVSTTFGIRKIEVDAAHGLRINGESVKLMGGCMHHDNGILGSAAIDRAEQRRVELMKTNGFNAIRCSHNPPSPAFLEACDRLGMMVIDEAFDMWKIAKDGNENDYHLYFNDWWQRDLDAMVLRDRNHPSVVLWSIGNEIPERADPGGVAIAKQLTDRIRQLDSTRPITAAINRLTKAGADGKQRPWSDTDAAFQYLDVAGYNYEYKRFEADHARKPDRVMLETESFALEAAPIWDTVHSMPSVIGDFVWTAMDYLGESGLGSARLVDADKPPLKLSPDSNLPPGTVFGGTSFPWFNAYCGDIDLIGNKKPQSYFRDVVWGRSKLEMAVLRPAPSGKVQRPTTWGWYDELRSWTWTPDKDQPLTVRIYTTGDHIKLLLNGKEAGSADVSLNTNLTAELSVPYAPGELKAVAFKDGKPFGEMSLKTVGAPYRVALYPDGSSLKADRNDLSFVMAHILDKEGNLVPDAVAEVSFKVSGPGELAAIGNANPREMDSFHAPRRRTFQGRCLAIVRPSGAPGQITVQATSAGLEPASLSLQIVNSEVLGRRA